MIPGMVGKNVEKWLKSKEGGHPSTVSKHGFTKEEIFMNFEVLKEKYGSEVNELPLGAIGIYNVTDKIKVGLQQLMAGSRSWAVSYINREDLASLTEECAFPCAAENEINSKDAENLVKNGIRFVCEGADMPSVPEAIDIFADSGIWYAPGTAANAGGVAVSCLEMVQNRLLLSWSAEEVDSRLKNIMVNIHKTCLDTAAEFGQSDNYLMGANIASFIRVVHAMQDQGLF